MNNLLERMKRMSSRVTNFLTLFRLDGQSKKPEGVIGQRHTSSLLTSTHSFVGRRKEKEEVINILLRTESGGAANVSVLPILGIGGVGKTTLVQVVYNDERVKNNFSLRMWVCVSEIFDVTKITREMLEQADPKANYAGITNFSLLHERLKEKLTSKKFLLVLDDIWNETENQPWQSLKTPLSYGRKGSTILLTSRLPNVAKLMGTMDPIELEGLPKDEYWSFFKNQSFGSANPEEHPRLVAIGKKIASKLNGSPLAAKTMGALLNDKLDVDHWERISEDEIWKSDKVQDGIIAALKLSYQHLPAHLQQCFAYLSVHPKDWTFERNNVISMWMAQGMIHHDNMAKRIEDVGEDYFNELVSKAFFQSTIEEDHSIEEDDTIEEDHYRIHDLLHDLAESVSKDDCFRIEGNEFRTIPPTIRHLYLDQKHLAKLKEHTILLAKLRTLVLYGNFSTNFNYVDLQDVVKQLRKVRLLDLSEGYLKERPVNLNSLIHLRYLDLSCAGIRENVAEGITKLYYLQTLNLDRVPAGINNLIQLRHLHTVSDVPGIGKLTCLQKLRQFSVKTDPEFQIGQLKYLRELRGCLNICNLDGVDSKEDAEEAKLCEKGDLEELSLRWDFFQSNMKPDEKEIGILEGLRPNANLKELKIYGYRGTMSPSWMVRDHSFTKLEKLVIFYCTAWKELPPLGQLPRLKDLDLCAMSAVKRVGTEFHGKDGFTSLESLKLIYFPQWEEWSTDRIITLFPRLVKFKIGNCPNLKTILPLPTTLQELEVEDFGMTALPEFLPPSLTELNLRKCFVADNIVTKWLQGVSSLDSLKIIKLPEITTISFPKGFQQLAQLELLIIEECEKLYSLPSLEALPSLKLLKISDCPNLNIIIGLEQLAQLESLCIGGCRDLSSKLDLEGLHSLKTLRIVESPKITTINGFKQLAQLESLCISRCRDLSPKLDLEGLYSLKSLEVTHCPKINTINGLGQMTELEVLRITFCEELSSTPGIEYLHLQVLSLVCCPKLDVEVHEPESWF